MKEIKPKTMSTILAGMLICASPFNAFAEWARMPEMCIVSELTVTSLRGQVMSIPGAKPLPEAAVILEGVRDDKWETIAEVKVDAGGRFAFENVRPGHYRLAARSEAYVSTWASVRLKKSPKNKTRHAEMIFWLAMPLEGCGRAELRKAK